MNQAFVRILAVAVFSLVLIPFVFAQPADEKDKKEKKEKVKATVEKIDHEKSSVTFKGPKGNLVTIKAGDKVNKLNFGQMKKGDIIVTEFYGEGAFVDVKRDDEGNWVLIY